MICVKDRDQCPITFIKWVSAGKKLPLPDDEVTKRELLNGTLVFSKMTDSLPLTSIKLQLEEPCLDPTYLEVLKHKHADRKINLKKYK